MSKQAGVAMSNVEAREGQWYSHRDSHETFCVIAVDEVHGVIDVRDGYGDIDEVDFDEWETMDLELCAAPDGWNAFLEGMEDVDLEQDVAENRPHNGASHRY